MAFILFSAYRSLFILSDWSGDGALVIVKVLLTRRRAVLYPPEKVQHVFLSEKDQIFIYQIALYCSYKHRIGEVLVAWDRQLTRKTKLKILFCTLFIKNSFSFLEYFKFLKQWLTDRHRHTMADVGKSNSLTYSESSPIVHCTLL